MGPDGELYVTTSNCDGREAPEMETKFYGLPVEQLIGVKSGKISQDEGDHS